MDKAIFGGGCFWGVEAAFRQVKGVKLTAVGYTGGAVANPTYELVCTGQTGHVEVVLVEYDPAVVSYEDLLTVFWEVHDPTTLDRQGPDVGTQYRSVIFHGDEAQETAARASMAAEDQSGRHGGPIVTEIPPASEFFMAEDYHQQFIEKRQGAKRSFF